ncbi:MAG: HAD-IIIC family phosphatase [Clostridium sp.]|jgi:FkbH-like protein|nr:HAD-IIIC family phosphatase [Clostridium sp.]
MVLDFSDPLSLLKQERRLPGLEPYDGRLAVVGTDSIQYLVKIIRLILFSKGIRAQIYEGEFDGIAAQILDRESALHRFCPDVLVVIPDSRDVKVYPKLLSSPEQIAAVRREVTAFYESLWAAFPHRTVLQANFVLPALTQLGNLEKNYAFSKTSFLQSVNEALLSAKPKNVTILDFEGLASYVGKKNWFDYSAYYLSRLGFRLDYAGYVGKLIAEQILADRAQVRKCLVLDLDDTLWGGIVGEDGADGLELNPGHAVGEAYRAFQGYLLELSKRGVILAVCSKNDPETAKEPFLKNPYMVLQLEDIACFVANWEDKASNLRRIAETLNIGLDSLVFVDDNPAERELVRRCCPEVTVIDLPEDPAWYPDAVERAGAFDWLALTQEDLRRNGSYRAERERETLRGSFVDYDGYLRELSMEGRILYVTEKEIDRFVQLIHKSNQFNLRAKRYSHGEILRWLEDRENRKLIGITLKDKFHDYGLISCVILHRRGEDCFLDTWLMSCRALKRGVEDFTIRAVAEAGREWNCRRLIGEYLPTKKNGMVKDLYPRLGFRPLSRQERAAFPDLGGEVYGVRIGELQERKSFITRQMGAENG